MTVGTPPIEVTRSRSIVSIATSGSKRPAGISTTLRARRVVSVIVERQPVTWNSGTTSSDADCRPASPSGGGLPRIALRDAQAR